MSEQTGRRARLTGLARDNSAQARGALLRELADLFLGAPDFFGPAALDDLDAILTAVAEKAPLADRRSLAERLADAPRAPRGILRRLARDDIAAAAPVLARSGALAETDLADIAREGTNAHRRAIAGRTDLSGVVLGALIETAGADILVTLAANPALSGDTLDRLVERARALPELQGALCARPNLSATHLTALYFCGPSLLKRDILRLAGSMDQVRIDETIAANRRALLAPRRGDDAERAAARRLVRDEVALDGLGPAALSRFAAEGGRIALELGISYLAGVSENAGQRIFEDRRGEAQALTCRALRYSRTVLDIVLSACDAEAGSIRIAEVYDRIPFEAAERILRFWRVEGAGAPGAETAPAPARAVG